MKAAYPCVLWRDCHPSRQQYLVKQLSDIKLNYLWRGFISFCISSPLRNTASPPLISKGADRKIFSQPFSIISRAAERRIMGLHRQKLARNPLVELRCKAAMKNRGD